MQPVTRRADDAPTKFLDQWIGDGPMGLQLGKGSLLIGAH